MKTTLNHKLSLNKQTVAKLNNDEMTNLYGGATFTLGVCWTDLEDICYPRTYADCIEQY